MIRLNVLLAAVLVVCALGLVTSQHRARKLFVDVERAHGQTRELEVRWDQLQLEQSTLTTQGQVENAARSRLDMISPAPDQMVILKP